MLWICFVVMQILQIVKILKLYEKYSIRNIFKSLLNYPKQKLFLFFYELFFFFAFIYRGQYGEQTGSRVAVGGGLVVTIWESTTSQDCAICQSAAHEAISSDKIEAFSLVVLEFQTQLYIKNRMILVKTF